MSAPTVEVGTKLPELSLHCDPTFVIPTAVAIGDDEDVHHDRDKSQAKEAKGTFLNILTGTRLVQRCIIDWAPPTAIIELIKLRLGVAWYAYDTVSFNSEVTRIEVADARGAEIPEPKVVGSNSLGDHVIATATLVIGDA